MGEPFRLGFCTFAQISPFVCVTLWALMGGLRVWALQKKNSLGQDPCDVCSILEAACRAVGEYYAHTNWLRAYF